MLANSGGLVYGTIAVGALLAAESARQETYPKTLGAVAITLLLYWLAHSYAEFTGRRLRKTEPFTLAELVRTAAHELSVLIGAAGPLLVLLIWYAAGGQLTTAVTAAIWTSAVMIVIIEALVGVRAQLSGRDLVMQTAFGAVLGLLVVAVRVLLQH